MKTFSRIIICSVFIGLLFSAGATGADNNVSEAQRLLNGLGYDAGPVDGSIGRRTVSAMETFLLTQGEPFDGTIDSNELARLNSAAEAIIPVLRFPGRLFDSAFGVETACNALSPSRYSLQAANTATVEPVIALNDSVSIGGSAQWDSMEPWIKTILSDAAQYDTADDDAAGALALAQLEKWAAAGAIIGTPVDNAYNGAGNRGSYRPSASAPVLDMENAAQFGYAIYYALQMLDGLPADRLAPVHAWADRIVDKFGPPMGDAVFESAPTGIWRLQARPMLAKAVLNGDAAAYRDYVTAYYDTIRYVVSDSGAILKNAKRGDRGLHYQSQGLLSIAAVLDIVDNQGGTIPADVEAKFHSAVTFLLDADRDNSKILPLAREGYNNPGDGSNPVRFYRGNAEHYWWMIYYISKYPETENAARLRYLISTYDTYDRVDRDMMATVWVPYPINCYRPFDLSKTAIDSATALVEAKFPAVEDDANSSAQDRGLGGVSSNAEFGLDRAFIVKNFEDRGFVVYGVRMRGVKLNGQPIQPAAFEIFTDFSGDVSKTQNLELFRVVIKRSSLFGEGSRTADYLSCGDTSAQVRDEGEQQLRLHVGRGAERNACILDKMDDVDRQTWSAVLANLGVVISTAGNNDAARRVAELHDFVD